MNITSTTAHSLIYSDPSLALEGPAQDSTTSLIHLDMNIAHARRPALAFSDALASTTLRLAGILPD